MHRVTHRNFVENVDKRAELCTIFFRIKTLIKDRLFWPMKKG